MAWVSKAYYAPTVVIRQLKLVYHMTMGTNSWGITLPILSRPWTHGPLALPEPVLFLMHQATAVFVSLLGEPHKYPNKAVETLYAWAMTIGFTPSKDNLPYIQLGMVRTVGVTFFGWSAEAASYIQRVAPHVPPPKNWDQLPLWHFVYLQNEFNCSYYNTKMIRRGVLTWGQLQSLADVRLLNALPRTWKGAYNHGGRLLNKVPSPGVFIPPQSTSKTGPGHGSFNSTPHSRGSATHKHQRYGNNGCKHSYRQGCGTLHNECCGTIQRCIQESTRGRARTSARYARKRSRSSTQWSSAP